jgi:hypothetical protein
LAARYQSKIKVRKHSSLEMSLLRFDLDVWQSQIKSFVRPLVALNQFIKLQTSAIQPLINLNVPKYTSVHLTSAFTNIQAVRQLNDKSKRIL